MGERYIISGTQLQLIIDQLRNHRPLGAINALKKIENTQSIGNSTEKIEADVKLLEALLEQEQEQGENNGNTNKTKR